MSKRQYANDKPINFGDGIAAIYIPQYLTPELHDQLVKFLPENVPYTRVSYQKYGKLRNTPRLTWCYGQYNNQDTATYRGKTFKTEPIPDWLLQIKAPIERFIGVTFNTVILNKYTDGKDHIGWHSDDEEFLQHHYIASISIGASRDFQMRVNNGPIHEIKLKEGSLLVFDGVKHCLPKRKGCSQTRYNITFRCIKDAKGVGNYYYYNRAQ